MQQAVWIKIITHTLYYIIYDLPNAIDKGVCSWGTCVFLQLHKAFNAVDHTISSIVFQGQSYFTSGDIELTPFMQLCEPPRGGQLSIHGNVVNVPADVNSTVSTLIRLINESQTISEPTQRYDNYDKQLSLTVMMDRNLKSD